MGDNTDKEDFGQDLLCGFPPHPIAAACGLALPPTTPIQSSTVHRALICRETHTRMRVGSSNH
jgi:hypothetical protein